MRPERQDQPAPPPSAREQARRLAEERLLERVKASLPALRDLLAECSDHSTYEDGIYRFYHQSLKVFRLQDTTLQIVTLLQSLAPDLALNRWFSRIVSQGTGKRFVASEHNARWLKSTRPILEAFFHARFFLEMAVRYAEELETPPSTLPSGWAALLYLYDLR